MSTPKNTQDPLVKSLSESITKLAKINNWKRPTKSIEEQLKEQQLQQQQNSPLNYYWGEHKPKSNSLYEDSNSSEQTEIKPSPSLSVSATPPTHRAPGDPPWDERSWRAAQEQEAMSYRAAGTPLPFWLDPRTPAPSVHGRRHSPPPLPPPPPPPPTALPLGHPKAPPLSFPLTKANLDSMAATAKEAWAIVKNKDWLDPLWDLKRAIEIAERIGEMSVDSPEDVTSEIEAHKEQVHKLNPDLKARQEWERQQREANRQQDELEQQEKINDIRSRDREKLEQLFNAVYVKPIQVQ